MRKDKAMELFDKILDLWVSSEKNLISEFSTGIAEMHENVDKQAEIYRNEFQKALSE